MTKTAYFTEPGNGWTIPNTEHLNSAGHAGAIEAATAAGFGLQVINIVEGKCEECIKILESRALAPIA